MDKEKEKEMIKILSNFKALDYFLKTEQSKNTYSNARKANVTPSHSYMLSKKFVQSGLITTNPLRLTEKGKKLKLQFDKLIDCLQKAKLESDKR